MDRNIRLFGVFMLNIFIAPITISKVAGNIYKTTSNNRNFTSFHLLLPLLFGSFLTFAALQPFKEWAWAIALFMYLGFCGCIATIRMDAREKWNISGHFVEDFASTLLLYPSVAVQLEKMLEKEEEIMKTGSNLYIFDSPS